MRRVVIDMQALFAAAAEDALCKSGFGFDTVKSKSPEQTLSMCEAQPFDVLLMDVMSYPPRTLEERLLIRDELKRNDPNGKIVLMVDENTEKRAADRVRRAKKDGLIDDFIYNSTSPTYLAVVLDAL